MGDSDRNERVTQWLGHRQTSRTLYGTHLLNLEGSVKNELNDGYQRSLFQKQGSISDDEKQCCQNTE